MNKNILMDIIRKVSVLVEIAPEIQEIDINPLFGTLDNVIAVDTRICI